jgi:glutathione peroxidase
MDKSVYELKAKGNDGKDFDFGSLRGKPILVVNTASKCGFTPQYKGLEALHRKYRDKGLAVIAFPCDQFAHQEPGDDSAIATFCEKNYGVTFPLMAKADVNGPGTHPVFAWLKKKAPGMLGSKVKWNFTKFLVWPDGSKVKRYAPTIEPEALEEDIEKALRT